MYTIKNTSSKIIHIGTTILMPDQTMEATEAVTKLPSIQAFVKMEMLKVSEAVEKNTKNQDTAEDDARSEDAAEDKTGEDKTGEDKTPEEPKARATRRTAKPKNTEE